MHTVCDRADVPAWYAPATGAYRLYPLSAKAEAVRTGEWYNVMILCDLAFEGVPLE